MKQLSGLDATFLNLETPEMPMHVGTLHVFELATGSRGKFGTRLRRHIARRLPFAPALRRRVWWMPLNLTNPAWVDADPDLSQHNVEIKLPPSAKLGDGLAALEAAVSPTLVDTGRQVVGTARRWLMGGLGQVSDAMGSAVGQLAGGVVKGAMTGAVRQAMAAVTSASPARRPQVATAPISKSRLKAACEADGKPASRTKAMATKAAVSRRKRRPGARPTRRVFRVHGVRGA